MKIKQKIRKITPRKVIKAYHFLWSFFGALIYRFPGRKIKVVGVTGTNGKTTTVKIISSILKEDKKKIAVMSSIDFEIAGEREKNILKMTMPGRGFVQRFLRRAVDKNCEVAVLEVTSEGIEQFRHKFVGFDIAVITNLTPEHIESHGGFENYKKAKGKLFKETKKVHILNVDDDHFEYFNSFEAEKKYGYGFEKENNNIKFLKGSSLSSSKEAVSFKCNDEGVKLKILGEFNAYNAMAAIAVSSELGVDFSDIKKSLENYSGVPGRMEKVISEPITVLVDYAFTPNALEKVYRENKRKCDGNLILVLGACGGGRDKWKRPVLGKIASQYGDKIIVTNEDPYDEDPMSIINQVAEGAEGDTEKILDRRKAIKKALTIAKKNDTVIITGKGSESWIQVENGKKIPWDDRKVVREEFKKIKQK